MACIIPHLFHSKLLPRLFGMMGALCIGMGFPAFSLAQDGAVAYPVDPTAAAGMTSGLPNSSTGRQIEMMQVRTSAQDAQGDAAAASLARSAGQSMETSTQESALKNARINKAIKDDMRNRLRYERAAERHEKVSAHDMSAWQQNGGIRVERNVPDAFITSLIAEEEEAIARGRNPAPKRRLLPSPSLPSLPLVGGVTAAGAGLWNSLTHPRLPFFGGGGSQDSEQAPTASAPPPSDNSEPVFAQSGNSGSRASAPAAAAPTAPAKPGMVPAISGAALVDGQAPQTASSADRPPSGSQRVSFADETPSTEKKKLSLFSRGDSDDAPQADNSMPAASHASKSSGGFFGFGRKKSSAPVQGIDSSLFPNGAPSSTPVRVSSSSGTSSRSSSSSSEMEPASFASDSVELPSQTIEKEKSGFSLPKPSIALPSLPTITKSESSGSRSSVNMGQGVISQTAQFMVYGADPMQSEIRALPAGTQVMITKPGDQWSGIQLSDGTEGIVQNKFLRSVKD